MTTMHTLGIEARPFTAMNLRTTADQGPLASGLRPLFPQRTLSPGPANIANWVPSTVIWECSPEVNQSNCRNVVQ